MADPIYFVTANRRKYEEYQEIVAKHGALLEHYDAELVEPQSTDAMHIIGHKLAQALKNSFWQTRAGGRPRL